MEDAQLQLLDGFLMSDKSPEDCMGISDLVVHPPHEILLTVYAFNVPEAVRPMHRARTEQERAGAPSTKSDTVTWTCC